MDPQADQPAVATPPDGAHGDPVPRVAVLLATYNGISFVSEQVESLLKQVSCAVDIWVSDDQSTDGTWEWLCDKEGGDTRLSLLPRVERFGNAARNFYRLMRDVDFSRYQYIALSDQDDLWFSEKLAVSIGQLRERGAAAVSSDVMALWPDGRRELIRKSQKQRSLDFLFESAGPGCTYVMTAQCAAGFKEFLARNQSAVAAVQFHDWMLYAWVRSRGFTWHILPRPTMLYRQHDKNEYGANSGWAAFRRRLAQVRSGWYREQILQISRLVCDGAAFTADCAATMRLVEARGFLARIALAVKVRELRREPKDRARLFLACMLGGI